MRMKGEFRKWKGNKKRNPNKERDARRWKDFVKRKVAQRKAITSAENRSSEEVEFVLPAIIDMHR